MRGVILCLLYPLDDVLIQPFVSDRADVAIDAGILLGLAGLDMPDGNRLLFVPFHQLSAAVFRAVVGSCGAGLDAPFDDAVDAPDDPFGGRGKVGLDTRFLAVEVIRNVQEPEPAPVARDDLRRYAVTRPLNRSPTYR